MIFIQTRFVIRCWCFDLVPCLLLRRRCNLVLGAGCFFVLLMVSSRYHCFLVGCRRPNVVDWYILEVVERRLGLVQLVSSIHLLHYLVPPVLRLKGYVQGERGRYRSVSEQALDLLVDRV